MHPETFLRVLGREPWRVAYVQPSRRPGDGRYGENPNRLYKHHQYQVILKPAPADVQDLYLGSLVALGIDPAAHDVRFEEDNWESPTLGAWGIGWQVLLDGQEITQFTYFQQAGGIDLAPISAEITYGLERIAMYLQDVDDVYDAALVPRRASTATCATRRSTSSRATRSSWPTPTCTGACSTARWPRAGAVLKRAGGRTVLAAYDWCLKASHAFNVLDARGAISVSQRAGMILGSASWPARSRPRYVAEPASGHRRPAGGRWPEFLLEIGFEEMPASWLPGLGEQLAPALRRAGRPRAPRAVGRSRALSTPRRLVLRRRGRGAPGRPRGAGLGPVAQGRAKTRPAPGRTPPMGFATKSGVRRREPWSRRRRTRPAGRAVPLLREARRPAARRARCCPG